MVVVIGVGSNSIHMRSMGSFSLISKEAEVFKYVVLCMPSDPRTMG